MNTYDTAVYGCEREWKTIRKKYYTANFWQCNICGGLKRKINYDRSGYGFKPILTPKKSLCRRCGVGVYLSVKKLEDKREDDSED